MIIEAGKGGSSFDRLTRVTRIKSPLYYEKAFEEAVWYNANEIKRKLFTDENSITKSEAAVLHRGGERERIVETDRLSYISDE